MQNTLNTLLTNFQQKILELSSRDFHRLAAIGEGVLATSIWSSSFVFVKLALESMGPLTIAGLRYFLAFIVLIPWLINRKSFKQSISGKTWTRLMAIGLSAYTIGNGAMFWGLKFLPATTVSFLLSLLPIFILVGSIVWLAEKPTKTQVFGVFISLLGSLLFFSSGFRPGEPAGIAIVSIGIIGFMVFGILGREIARIKGLDTLTLTAIPLAIGGGILLLIALPLEGLPSYSIKTLGIVLWLAVVNTAIAYLLYNHALQCLTALEMNILLNIGPVGTALLSWWLLNEKLGVIKIIGLVIMILGVMFVQRIHADNNKM